MFVFVVLSPFCLKVCCWLYRCSSHSQTLSCPLGNIYVSFCFSGGFLGSSRATWPISQIPLPARSSLCNEVMTDMIYPACEFQSKQQLVVFSSLRDTVDPLWKACYSLHSSPGDIPTLFFLTHILHLWWSSYTAMKIRQKVNSPFKPHRNLHLMLIKFPCVKYHRIMALTEKYLCANLHHILQSYPTWWTWLL